MSIANNPSSKTKGEAKKSRVPSPAIASEPGSSGRSKSRWPWTLINFWLDSYLLVNFLAVVGVATIVRFIFPPASAAQQWSLWGYSLDAWMGLQFGLTAALTLGVLIHIMLHWSWVCGVFFSRLWPKHRQSGVPDDGTRTIYGVGLMIVILNILGLLIAAAALSIRSPH